METILTLTRELELKKMDGALLSMALLAEAHEVSEDFEEDMREAVGFAAYVHRDATRANRGNLPRDTYITHPLRNALRLIRYGVTDQGIILAAVLHDTLEDCSYEIADKLMTFTSPATSKEQAKVRASVGLMELFADPLRGEDVTGLVWSVTNPFPPADVITKDQKRAFYIEHVLEAIKGGRSFLVKLTDWVDNAAGLYHNTGSPDMQKHLALKYLPLLEPFGKRLMEPDVQSLLTSEGYKKAAFNIYSAQERLETILEQK